MMIDISNITDPFWGSTTSVQFSKPMSACACLANTQQSKKDLLFLTSESKIFCTAPLMHMMRVCSSGCFRLVRLNRFLRRLYGNDPKC